jgi:1-acyl-sn-glycerol-3-phosphate acyltransferase
MPESVESDIKSKELSSIKPMLKFLHQIWWRVQLDGLSCLPDNGPALIVGNTSGYIPWPALMLIYSLNQKKGRTVYTVIDDNLLEDEKLRPYLSELNFMPWSYDNAKTLLNKGEIIVLFPEDNSVTAKTIAMRNRTRRFDWTKFLPAVELHVPIYPLSTLGIDEANICLPFPLSLSTLPVPWTMKLMPALTYSLSADREALQEQAKKTALRAEGDIQAQLNRSLRNRARFF